MRRPRPEADAAGLHVKRAVWAWSGAGHRTRAVAVDRLGTHGTGSEAKLRRGWEVVSGTFGRGSGRLNQQPSRTALPPRIIPTE